MKKIERKTEVTRKNVCKLSVIIMVLSPPLNVYDHISARHISTVTANGT
jgi:hypothetical protein